MVRAFFTEHAQWTQKTFSSVCGHRQKRPWNFTGLSVVKGLRSSFCSNVRSTFFSLFLHFCLIFSTILHTHMRICPRVGGIRWTPVVTIIEQRKMKCSRRLVKLKTVLKDEYFHWALLDYLEHKKIENVCKTDSFIKQRNGDYFSFKLKIMKKHSLPWLQPVLSIAGLGVTRTHKWSSFH